jgi:hypothetical protein
MRRQHQVDCYVDVYVRVNGRWKVCSVQTTRIATP